jgi:hypothetical protein
MTNFATMMESQDKPLRRLSPMQRDIFRQKMLYNIFFLISYEHPSYSKVFGISTDNNLV